MKQIHLILLLVSLNFLLSPKAKGQSIVSYPNTTTYLNYYTTTNFINGVNSGTLTITLNNLNNNTDYNLYFRSQNSAFNATSPSGTILLNEVSFTCISIVNSSSNNSGKAPTNIIMANSTELVYSNSFSTSAPILVSFRTGSNHSGSDIMTITFRIIGPTNLCVAGNTTTNGNTYGLVTMRYDLYRVSNGTLRTSGSNHRIGIRVKDALGLTINNPTTTLLVNSASELANGFTQVVDNQISIISNEPFNLRVRASSADFTASGTLDKIPTNYMQLKINNSNTSGWTISGFTALNGTTNITLASIITRANDINLSIAYKLAPLIDLSNKTPALYTTTLTYTATQN
jgi:hypothetical protein